MTQFVQAIFEQGVFRPLQPVILPEHEQVSLEISPAESSLGGDDVAALKRQKEALRRALDEAADLPIEAPDDGFGGADHDFILYGWKK